MTRDAGETAQYLYDVTRAVADNPYKDIKTELDYIAKAKAFYDGGNLEDNQPTVIDLYMRQLMQFSGVTEGKARGIVKGACYLKCHTCMYAVLVYLIVGLSGV